jgi:HK97 family phage portal protein
MTGGIGRGFRALFRMASMTFQGYGGQGYGWRLLLPGSQYDYEAAAGDLWRNSAVAACLRWLRINFPEPILEACRDLKDGTVEAIPGHECVRLLQRPNPHYDWWTFSAAWVLSAVVDGNSYALKIRSSAGKVIELWWIPHWLIWPRWEQDGSEFIGWYEYSVNGKIIRIPPSEVIHYRQGIDPRDDRKGFSELKQCVRAVCGLNECDTYTASIMRNMGMPTAVISFDGDGMVQPDDLEELQQQWRERFAAEGRGSPLFSPRKMTVARLSMSPEELKLDELPARLEDQVHAAIGLSPMVTGATSGAKHKTYANYGEARKAAYEDCLIPMQKAMASCWTQQLLEPEFWSGPAADRLRFDYRTVQCLAENENELGERVGKQYQTYQVIKRSEAREALGYDWGPEDEVYFAEANPAPAMTAEAQGDDEPDEPAADKPESRVSRVLGLLETRLSHNGDGAWHSDGDMN